MLPAGLTHLIAVVLTQAPPAPAMVMDVAAAQPQADVAGAVNLVIQIVLLLAAAIGFIWRSSAQASAVKEQIGVVKSQLDNLQPKMDCVRCKADLEARIMAVKTESEAKIAAGAQSNALLAQRLDSVDKTLSELKVMLQQLLARPIGRQQTNPRIPMPTFPDDEGNG